MDKILTKRVAITCGIKTAKFCSCSIFKWQNNKELILKEVRETLKLPIFVKPSHLGSSIGLSKVDLYEDLSKAIDNAFSFDTDVLIEEGIKGREIEFSVLGNFDPFIADPGEIITDGKVYDFDAKYGNQCMSAKVPCQLGLELIEEGKNLTRKIYEAIGGSGLSRIDFFLDENGQYWLNEINPIPGFTEISVYPKALIHSGFKPQELIDELVILGLQIHRTKDRHLNQ
jgi:D-alanine--D-alanine ligase